MRLRLSRALVLSLGLHALPCWWLWPSLVEARHPTGEMLTLTVLSERDEPVGDPRAARVADRTPDLAANDRVRRAHATRDRLRADLSRALDKAARARKRATIAADELTDAVARVEARTADQAERADLLLTSAGRLRIAKQPMGEAAAQLQRANAGRVRALAEAHLAADRALRLEEELAKRPSVRRGRPKQSEAQEMDPQARVNAERTRADAAARQVSLAEAVVADAVALEAAAQAVLAPVEREVDEDKEALAAAKVAREAAELERAAAADRLAEALATASQAEQVVSRTGRGLQAAPTAWVKVPEPNGPEPHQGEQQTMASTLSAPAASTSSKESASSALSANEDQVARPGAAVSAQAPDPSRDAGTAADASAAADASTTAEASATADASTTAEASATAETSATADASATAGPPHSGEPGSEYRPRAGGGKGGVAASDSSRGARSSASGSSAASPNSNSAQTGPGAHGSGSDGGGSAGGPLIFVRTAGERSATWDPSARFIGTQSIVSTLKTRAPTSTVADLPVMALPEEEIPEETDDARLAAILPPKPKSGLPDLDFTGRGADGFALFLVDEHPNAPADRTAAPPVPLDPASPPHLAPRILSAPLPDDDRFWALLPPLQPDTSKEDAHEPAGSLAVLPEDVALGAITAMTVSAHPLAGWMTELDDMLRDRWIYPPDLRALGVEGTVEVSFKVLPNGRITEVVVTQTDADPTLVFAALASIPPSVNAPPPGWGRLGIRYTYRYRAGG